MEIVIAIAAFLTILVSLCALTVYAYRFVKWIRKKPKSSETPAE